MRTLVVFTNSAGGSVVIGVDDDRNIVESLGGLLPGMTIESMRNGMSRIRNQVIAQACREAGMIEQWGYGVQRMFHRAAELGLDEPQYVELPGRLRFIVSTRHAAIMTGGLRSSQLCDEPVDSAPETLSNDRVLRLLQAARAPVSRADILAAIGLGNDSRNSAKNIEPLLAAGLMSMSDPNNSRRRSQRYLTTDKGLE